MVCTQAELTEQRNAAEAEIDLLEKRREEAVQACMRVQSELREAKDNKEYHQASTTHKTFLLTSFGYVVVALPTSSLVSLRSDL